MFRLLRWCEGMSQSCQLKVKVILKVKHLSLHLCFRSISPIPCEGCSWNLATVFCILNRWTEGMSQSWMNIQGQSHDLRSKYWASIFLSMGFPLSRISLQISFSKLSHLISHKDSLGFLLRFSHGIFVNTSQYLKSRRNWFDKLCRYVYAGIVCAAVC